MQSKFDITCTYLIKYQHILISTRLDLNSKKLIIEIKGTDVEHNTNT